MKHDKSRLGMRIERIEQVFNGIQIAETIVTQAKYTKDLNGQLDDMTIEVVRSICFDTYPPSNPAVILAAAREWYRIYGADDVLRQCICWLVQIEHIDGDTPIYNNARTIFQANTGIVDPDSTET